MDSIGVTLGIESFFLKAAKQEGGIQLAGSEESKP